MGDNYYVGILMIVHHYNIAKYINSLKWVAITSQIIATILLISPTIAAVSTIPWILYEVGAIIWLIDSIMLNNKQLAWISVFFIVYDGLIIVSRVIQVDLLEPLAPMITAMQQFTK